MAARIRLADGGRFLGQATIFDAAPSFSVLNIAFPAARAVIWSSCGDCFTVDVGDTPPIARAE